MKYNTCNAQLDFLYEVFSVVALSCEASCLNAVIF